MPTDTISKGSKSTVKLSPQEEQQIKQWLQNIDTGTGWLAFEEKYRKIMKQMSIRYANLDKEDVIDEVMYDVITDKESYLSKDITFMSFLNTKVKKRAFQMICDKFGVDKNDYEVYLKVSECCNRYDISCCEANAYKIAGLTGMSISKVMSGIKIYPIISRISYKE